MCVYVSPPTHFSSVFWDLYCAAPDRRETCEHSSEAKAFHDYVSTVVLGGGALCPRSPPHPSRCPRPPPPPLARPPCRGRRRSGG